MAIPLIGAVIGAGSSLLTWLVMRVVAIFGIGFVSIVGVRPLLNTVTGLIRNMFNINTPEWFPIFQWLGVLKFDICVSIWLSAVTAKLLFSGLNSSGGMKKMRVGGGS